MKKIWAGFLISVLIHAALYGGARAYIAYEAAHPGDIDIDLAGSSLIRKPKNAPQGMPANVVPPQPWILSSGRYAPQPKALTYTPQTQIEAESVPCPPPCPANPGDWMPAAATSEKPQWTPNISDSDYPREAIRQGRSGLVVVLLLIDANGVVRDAQIVQSSHPSMDEMVLRKLQMSKFRPAYDHAGNAVACRLKMPIRFELN